MSETQSRASELRRFHPESVHEDAMEADDTGVYVLHDEATRIIRELEAEIAKANSEIKGNIENLLFTGCVVQCREGGGPENHYVTLATSVMKAVITIAELRTRLAQMKEDANLARARQRIGRLSIIACYLRSAIPYGVKGEQDSPAITKCLSLAADALEWSIEHGDLQKVGNCAILSEEKFLPYDNERRLALVDIKQTRQLTDTEEDEFQLLQTQADQFRSFRMRKETKALKKLLAETREITEKYSIKLNDTEET